MPRVRYWISGFGSLAVTLLAMASLAVGQTARTAGYEMTDAGISEAVDDQLYIDQAIASQRIESRADDGVVTLSGVVSNVLAKERAARIAETVKGVRAVVNTIEVRPTTTRSPSEIADDVTAALAEDPATESWDVDVSVAEGGTVTLTGAVDSLHEKNLAALVAKGVRGVTNLINAITVRFAEVRPDAEIEQEIEQALRWDALVDHELIDVAVNDGTVTLSGTVASAAERSYARLDAWTAGVKAVDDSRLVVAKWTRDPTLRQEKYVIKSDEAVRDAVEAALARDPRVRSDDVRPAVLAGTVTLRGRVESLRAKRAAAEDARNTVGAVSVINRVKVRPPDEVPDGTLEDRVGDALTRDPFVERFDIAVGANNGIVYLEGTVDTYFQQARADIVASGVQGVVAVENDLVVRRSTSPLTYNPYRGDPYVYSFDWYDYQPRLTMTRDQEIAERIRRELWWSPFIDSDDITVTVNDGVATLEGTVQSWSEYSTAHENALEGGATWVNNDITIDLPPPNKT